MPGLTLVVRVRIDPRIPNGVCTGLARLRKLGTQPLGYNLLVSLTTADRGDVLHIPSAAKALTGLLISGLLFGFLGAILPAWGYHLSTEFSTVGNYFLSMSAGVILSTEAAGRLLLKRGAGFLLVTARSLRARRCCIWRCCRLVFRPSGGWPEYSSSDLRAGC